jgi:predicted phosphodiesterase
MGGSSMSVKFGIILSDLHAPYHSESALKLVCKVIKDTKPAYVTSIGDMLDMMAVMTHQKTVSQRKVSLVEEIKAANAAIDQIDAVAGKAKKILVSGNHESRVDRYLTKNAPDLEGIISVAELMQAPRRGWEVIPYGEHKRIGKLVLTHDVGISGERSIFAAEKDFNTNVVTGHTHIQRWAVVGNGRGDSHVTASGGWLGDPKHATYVPEIKKQRNWSHGFNVFHLLPNGNVFVTPVPIVDGQCIVNGTVYSVK